MTDRQGSTLQLNVEQRLLACGQSTLHELGPGHLVEVVVTCHGLFGLHAPGVKGTTVTIHVDRTGHESALSADELVGSLLLPPPVLPTKVGWLGVMALWAAFLMRNAVSDFDTPLQVGDHVDRPDRTALTAGDILILSLA
jgi:hypothetical protein